VDTVVVGFDTGSEGLEPQWARRAAGPEAGRHSEQPDRGKVNLRTVEDENFARREWPVRTAVGASSLGIRGVDPNLSTESMTLAKLWLKRVRREADSGRGSYHRLSRRDPLLGLVVVLFESLDQQLALSGYRGVQQQQMAVGLVSGGAHAAPHDRHHLNC